MSKRIQLCLPCHLARDAGYNHMHWSRKGLKQHNGKPCYDAFFFRSKPLRTYGTFYCTETIIVVHTLPYCTVRIVSARSTHGCARRFGDDGRATYGHTWYPYVVRRVCVKSQRTIDCVSAPCRVAAWDLPSLRGGHASYQQRRASRKRPEKRTRPNFCQERPKSNLVPFVSTSWVNQMLYHINSHSNSF